MSALIAMLPRLAKNATVIDQEDLSSPPGIASLLSFRHLSLQS